MAKLILLSDWLNEQSDHVVAVQMANTVSTVDFKHRVKKWLTVLSEHEGSRWAVYHADAFEFLAILFALWQLDRTACIPGDNCAGTVERLSNYVDGFVGGFPTGLIIDDTSRSLEDPSTEEWKKLKPDFIALEIYTSGSTGVPKPITKTIAQLEREIDVLESQWPSQQDCVVLATVSHQHLYGMTFRLLWPFSAGQPFARLLSEYSEDIFHHAQHYAIFSLISSPSHLARMNTVVNWNELTAQCQYVISSSAPLARVDSVNVSRLLDTTVREIYGSSETGAMAWRIQLDCDNDALWQALPKVDLSTASDNTLIVGSPYLTDNEPLNLPDRVRFHHHEGFELIGRIDNIVKVEGKRVSLTAIERVLLENEWVEQVKALTLNRKRVETAVVIQLTELGEHQLKTVGRKAVIKGIKSGLIGYFEPVVLPRRWRFIEHLPYNAQGKLPMETLRALFEKEPVKWPKINDKLVDDKKATIQCHIPADLIYFDGHFDDNPILPGVVQVYWAEKFGRQLLPVDGRFKRLEAIKFLQIIGPNSWLTISLEYNETNNSLAFKYQSEKGLHSTGRLYFD